MGTKIKAVSTGLILSAAFSFMITVFAPTEFYIFNSEDLWFDYYDMLSTLAILFASVFLLNSLLFCLLRKAGRDIYRWFVFFETVVLVYTYIQGNYLAAKLPGLDGTVINWAEYAPMIPVSVVLFLVLTAVLAVLLKIFHFPVVLKIAKGVGIYLFLILAVTLVFNIFKNSYTFFREKIDQNITVKDEMLLSSDRNMVILLLDRIESEDVENFMREDPGKYADCFEDFTYYRDAMGGYSRTEFSIPLILTGNQYKNDEDYYDFYTRSVLESPLFSNLEKRDYSMEVYDVTNFICNDPSVFDRFSNILETRLEFKSKREFAAMLMRMIGYKYAPYGLKQFFNADRVDFKELEVGKYDYGYDRFIWFNGEYYDLINSQPFEKEEKKHFKWIHLEGGHRPYDLKADMSFLDEDHEYPAEKNDPVKGKEGYREKEKASLKVAKTMIEKLKEEGLYDNSVIVILSDHGDYYHETYKAQNPLLLVKGVNEHHPMKVSMAPVSYVTDLQAAFENLLDGKASDEIFAVKEGDKVKRQYLFYNDWRDHSVLYEYEQTGHATDMDTFVLTGNTYVKPENKWESEELVNAKHVRDKKLPAVVTNQ